MASSTDVIFFMTSLIFWFVANFSFLQANNPNDISFWLISTNAFYSLQLSQQ